MKSNLFGESVNFGSVGRSVGGQSVDKWSVVGGSVVGGFNKTQPKNSQVINFDTTQCILIIVVLFYNENYSLTIFMLMNQVPVLGMFISSVARYRICKNLVALDKRVW